MSKTLYSIIIPVYKSTTSLEELAKRVDIVFSNISNSDYELIFINDSPFYLETKKILEEIIYKYPKVVVIELMKNFGQQPATLCGIENSKGDYIITMDDDLQHAPEDIPSLIKKQKHDVVIAKLKRIKHNIFKRISSNIKGYFDYIILGKPKNIKLSSFRLIKSSITKLMFKRKTPYPFIPALLFSITLDIVNVEVEHNHRNDGKSNYTFFKLVQVFSNLMINNSSLLLRVIGYLGICIAFLSVIFGLIIIYKKIFLDYILLGWSSTMVALLFFGGMTLFTLGVIGEYLIRIIATTEERPVYYIRKINTFKVNE